MHGRLRRHRVCQDRGGRAAPCSMRSAPPRPIPHCTVTKARLRSQPAGRWPAPCATRGETTPQTRERKAPPRPVRAGRNRGQITQESRSSVPGITVKCAGIRTEPEHHAPEHRAGVDFAPASHRTAFTSHTLELRLRQQAGQRLANTNKLDSGHGHPPDRLKLRNSNLIRGRGPIQVLVSWTITPLSEHQWAGAQARTPGRARRRRSWSRTGRFRHDAQGDASVKQIWISRIVVKIWRANLNYVGVPCK